MKKTFYKPARQAKMLWVMVILSIFLSLLSSVSAVYTDTGAATQNVNDCGTLNTTNAVYTLTQNVVGASACFIIAANNITLNGAGFNVNYSASTVGIGISTLNYNFTTIKNTKVNQLVDYGDLTKGKSAGISVNHSSNSLVFNNTVNTLGRYEFAVLSARNSNVTIMGNTLFSGPNDNSYVIFIEEAYYNLSIIGNRINSTGAGGTGIFMHRFVNNSRFDNNNITITGGDGAAIYIKAGSSNNVFNNNILLSTTTSNGQGVIFDTDDSVGGTVVQNPTKNNSFQGNSIITTNTNGKAIKIYSNSNAHNFTLRDSYLNESQSGIKDLLVETMSSGVWNFTNVTRADGSSHINVSWDATSKGDMIMNWYLNVNVSSSNLPLSGTTVIVTDIYSNSQTISSDSNGMARFIVPEFIRNNTGGKNWTWFSNYSISISKSGYNTNSSTVNLSTNTLIALSLSETGADTEYPQFFNYWDNNATIAGNGIARFNVSINRTNGTVFMQINGVNYSATNLTSNVYNVSVNLSSVYPFTVYPYYWGSWGNGSSHNYNVSNVRYYYLNGSTSLTNCGTLSLANTIYTLTANVTSNGTCFTIVANNITLDGAGFTINYSARGVVGYGINATNYNSTTIKNVIIQEGSGVGAGKYSIYFQSSNNNTIINNTIKSAIGYYAYGIYFSADGGATLGSSYNIINNNTIISDSIYAYGIYFASLSKFNLVTNNIISMYADNAADVEAGVYLDTLANNNYISNNTINSTGTNSYGIYTKSSSDIIINNVITTSGTSSYGIGTTSSINLSILNNTITTSASSIVLGTASIYSKIDNNIITVSGSSSGIYIATDSSSNVMNNNTISSTGSNGKGVTFDAPGSRTANNTFYGMNIKTNNINGAAISILPSVHNFSITDSKLNASYAGTYDLNISKTVIGNIWNFTNVTRYDGTNSIIIYWTPSSIGNLIMNWYLDINTTSSNSPLSGVLINITDIKGDNLTATSDANGFARFTLPEYIRNNTGGLSYSWLSNYTITASKATYNTKYSAVNLSNNQLVGLSFTALDSTYPQFSNYWDNNATLINSGLGLFNVSVSDTNGTVILHINGASILATNLSANVYNASYNFSADGNYNYYWTAYGNGNNNNLNTSSTRYYFVNAYNINSTTYNASTYETSHETFIINFSVGSIISATARMVYKGTSYSSNVSCGGSYCTATNNIDIPIITSGTSQNKTFYWTIFLYYGGTQSTMNSSVYTQTVKQITLNQCTSGTRALNYTSWDEQNFTRISPFGFDANFNYYLGGGTTYKQYNYTNISTGEVDICIGQNATTYIDAIIAFNAPQSTTAYSTRNYFYQKHPISNITQDVNLYQLKDSASTSFILSVIDKTSQPVANVLVNTQRCYVGLGDNRTVFVHRTDSNGFTVGNFEAETALYQFFITNYSNTLLAVTPCAKVIPQTAPYTLTFQIGGGYSSPFIDINNATGITESLTFNVTSNTFTLSYADTSDSFTQAELLVKYLNASGSSEPTVCDLTNNNSAGIITCNVSKAGTYSARAYIYRTDQILIDQIVAVVQTISGVVGYYGAFLGFFIIVVCGFAFKFNEIAGVILVTVGCWFVNLVGLINFGYVYLTAMTCIAIIIIGVLER